MPIILGFGKEDKFVPCFLEIFFQDEGQLFVKYPNCRVRQVSSSVFHRFKKEPEFVQNPRLIFLGEKKDFHLDNLAILTSEGEVLVGNNKEIKEKLENENSRNISSETREIIRGMLAGL